MARHLYCTPVALGCSPRPQRVLLGALAFVVAACSSGSASPSLADSTTTVASAGTSASDDQGTELLPLGWYIEEAANQRSLIARAIALEVSDCMRAAGFEYRLPTYRADADFVGKRYGVTPEIASQIGFLSLDVLDADRPDDREPIEPIVEPGSPMERALVGIESAQVETSVDGLVAEQTGGCLGAARFAVFGSFEAWLEFGTLDVRFQTMIGSAYDQALASPRVQSTLKTWSTCMSDRGFAVTDRDELLNRHWPEPRPTADEVRLALADAECLVDAKYRATLLEAEAAAQHSILDDRVGDVEDFAELRREVLGNARRVLEQS